MKTLSPDQMVEMVQPDPAALDAALRDFDAAAPILCRKFEHLKILVEGQWIEVKQINVAGQPAYLIGFHQTPDLGFWFDLVKVLGPHTGDWTIVDAIVEGLARHRKAPYIRWLTYRQGIARWARARGYTPEAVILTKVL